MGGIIEIEDIANNIAVHLRDSEVDLLEASSFLQEAISTYLDIAVSSDQAQKVFNFLRKKHRVRMPELGDRNGKVKFI